MRHPPHPLVNNVGVRKVVIGGLTALLAAVVLGAGVDFGASIYAEYRLSRAVRTAAQLSSDPNVALLAFPFIPQARTGHYDELEIKAIAVDRPRIGTATLEATMHSIAVGGGSWLINPDTELSVGALESRVIIDSRHLGRYIGIIDLSVEAPRADTNDATGGTTESGISGNEGLVFSGTPKAAGFDHRVSVSVDLTLEGPDQSVLVMTPTAILTGPDTANQRVPDDKQAAVLAAFRNRLADQNLPFAVAPTSWGARGSDVIIEGITDDVTITPAGFRPVGPR